MRRPAAVFVCFSLRFRPLGGTAGGWLVRGELRWSPPLSPEQVNLGANVPSVPAVFYCFCPPSGSETAPADP